MYSIENNKNYHKDVRDYIKQLPKLDHTVSEDEGDEFCMMCTINFPGLIINVVKNDAGEREIVFVLGPNEDPVYYHPEKIEIAKKSVAVDGKDMISFKIDDKFWFYEERIPFNPLYANFGMDMNYAFLGQQDWDLLKDEDNIDY